MGDPSGARRSLFLAVQSSKREGECTSEGGGDVIEIPTHLYNLHGINDDNETCIGDDFVHLVRVRRALGRVIKRCQLESLAKRLVMKLIDGNTG